MSEQITRCTAAGFDELTAYLARAVGKPSGEWFVTNLSALYRPIEELMQCSYVARRDGKIVGCVGAFPMQWRGGGGGPREGGAGGGGRGRGGARRRWWRWRGSFLRRCPIGVCGRRSVFTTTWCNGAPSRWWPA